MANFFLIEGLTFWGVSGSTKYAIKQEVSGLTSLTRCAIAECSNGIHMNHSGGSMTLIDIGIYNLSITTIRGIFQEAGVITSDSFTAALGNITTLIETTGINSFLRVSNMFSELSTLGTGIFINDNAEADLISVHIGHMNDGLVVEDGSLVRVNSSYIHDAQNDGFRINDVGVGTRVTIQSTTIEDCIGFDINVLASDSTLLGGGITSIDNVNFVAGARIYAGIIDDKEDDEGFNVLGELHVGVAERGSESTLGEGDSYTRGMMVYTYDGTSFVDVSPEARSASSSSFTFPNVSADTAIYVASSLTGVDVLQHYGFKSKTNTVAVLGSGKIIIEYYNGSSWVEVNGMEVDSGGAYFPHAKNYFQSTDSSHIRYDSSLAIDSWTKNDAITPSLGTDYYWVRLRIESEITTAPIFEQFKLHTNRFEINGDGWIEYFGKARPISKLPWEVQVFEKATGTDVKDQDLYLSKGIDNGGKKNKFIAQETDPNKVQRIGFKTTLPLDMDTSTPVDFQWSVVTDDISTPGTIDWIIRWGYNSDGDNVYTTTLAAPATGATEQINNYIATAPSATNKVKWYKILLDVSEMISRRENGFGDTIWVSIERSSTDTHSGDVSLVAMAAYYTKWCEGGHV